MYIELNDQLGDDKINFDFNDGNNGRFFTTGDALNISIGSHGDADQLLHEMFHAYQYFKRTAPGFLDGLINVEIEAHYAQYLYASGREDYKGSEWEKRDNNEPRRIKIRELDELMDEKGKLRPGVNESELEIRLLNEVIPVFQKINAYKDYSLDYDRMGLNNFDTLEELTTDC